MSALYCVLGHRLYSSFAAALLTNIKETPQTRNNLANTENLFLVGMIEAIKFKNGLKVNS
jgi:hypothetical protein